VHPELIELQALAAGILDPARQRAVDEHLGSCADCARKYVEVFLVRPGNAKHHTGQMPKPEVTIAAPVAAPAIPVAPVDSPAPSPVFTVSAPSPVMAPAVAVAAARPASPSPARVETVVTLRSGNTPTVELHALPDAAPDAGRYGTTGETPSPVRSLGAPEPIVDDGMYAPAPPTARPVTAAPAADTLDEAMGPQPTLAEALTRLRSSGMTHMAKSLTPVTAQAAVGASVSPIGAAPSAMAPKNRMLMIAAAVAVVVIGGGAVAYRGMVSAARAAATEAAAAARTASPAPVASAPAPVVATPTVPPASPATGTRTTPPPGAATAAPTAVATAKETRREAERTERPKGRDEERAKETPTKQTASAALPTIALPDVSGAVDNDASVDRLSGRNASRAAASDLQKSAGWATSRTSKP
jgi:hypothetical protein